MAALCRWIVVLTLLLAGSVRLCAASAADQAFRAARDAFQDKFYDRAEAQFADFTQKYPTSPRLPEAILLQAQARLELSNYAGAIQLLSARQGSAGTNADECLFWLAEAHSRKGDWRAAVDAFAKLVKDFPASPRCLEAALREASARAALAQTEPAEWRRVIELLRQTNGVFQSAVRTNASSDVAVQGCLLLSEAQLATKDYSGAEATLQPLAKHLLKPVPAWQWQYLLCRIQLADGRIEAALQSTTNLLAQARSTGQTNLLAESVWFQARLFERLGRTNEAIAAYQQNLAPGVPPGPRREALLKIAELSLPQNIPEAAQMLEKFLAGNAEATLADLALLTLGELRMRQCAPGIDSNNAALAATNSAATTNVLQLAEASFTNLVTKFPQSPLVGKAQLDLGWCYWREGRMAEAQTAFQAAVQRPLASNDLAMAYFRLAECQLQQTNYAGAIKNYGIIIEKFGSLPEARTNLLERALTQTVWAAVATNDLATATNALQKAVAWYPARLDTGGAVLLTAQAIGRRGDAAGQRSMLQEFARAVPRSPLVAEVQLAVADSYEQEKKWAEAIAQYDQWLSIFTNSEARARAEYNRASATGQAGRLTNALVLFTNFVAHFPTNELAPYAQIWVADYYSNAGDLMEAERNYKLIFQNPDWARSDLAYDAQYMAGRAAVRRQGWPDAKSYFLGLYNNLNGPKLDLRLQALFDYGQSLQQWEDPKETNKLANCEEATRIFGEICDRFPTSPLAIPAWTARANSYMKWALAKQQYYSLTNALNAFQKVVDSEQADVRARSEAKIGQAIVLEKWAEQKAGAEGTTLLNQALSNCLDVVYGNILRTNETALDAFQTKEAGLKAFSLAEALQAWPQVVSLHDRLTKTVWPQLPESLEKRTNDARDKIRQEKLEQ
jgi:TolA-binding protein